MKARDRFSVIEAGFETGGKSRWAVFMIMFWEVNFYHPTSDYLVSRPRKFLFKTEMVLPPRVLRISSHMQGILAWLTPSQPKLAQSRRYSLHFCQHEIPIRVLTI